MISAHNIKGIENLLNTTSRTYIMVDKRTAKRVSKRAAKELDVKPKGIGGWLILPTIFFFIAILAYFF